MTCEPPTSRRSIVMYNMLDMLCYMYRAVRLFFDLWGEDWYGGHKITAWEAYQVAKIVWLS